MRRYSVRNMIQNVMLRFFLSTKDYEQSFSAEILMEKSIFKSH